MFSSNKNIVVRGIPLSIDEGSKASYQLLLARLEDALRDFPARDNDSKPLIRISFARYREGILYFHGQVWGENDKGSQYSRFAKEISAGVREFRAIKNQFDVNIQVYEMKRSRDVHQSSKEGLFRRKPTQFNLTQSNEPDSYFRLINPLWSFDDIVLSPQIERAIQRALKLLQSLDIVYEDWGIKSIDPFPSRALNFFGPSGTGKTMAAHAVANQLGHQLLTVSIAEIESRFVGESPKNLERAFHLAESVQAVLFFDEAEAILGKRISDVSQGSEQAINSLRSQMLVSLDSFRGIVIFATNLIASYDFAFRNRITHIEFKLPTLEERKRIWRRHLPPSLPLDSEIDFDQLAELSDGFSGRDIKNMVIQTIGEVLVSNKENLKYSDIIDAIQSTRKQTNNPLSEIN